MAKKIFIIVVIMLVLSLLGNIYGLYKYRQQSQSNRNQVAELERTIADAASANKQLEELLESSKHQLVECGNIVDGLSSSSRQSVETIDDLIELFKSLRTQIESLEIYLDLCSSCSNNDHNDCSL